MKLNHHIAIIVSNNVLLRFPDSDYLFGIFKLLPADDIYLYIIYAGLNVK